MKQGKSSEIKIDLLEKLELYPLKINDMNEKLKSNYFVMPTKFYHKICEIFFYNNTSHVGISKKGNNLIFCDINNKSIKASYTNGELTIEYKRDEIDVIDVYKSDISHEEKNDELPPISLTGNLLPPISLTGNLQHEPPSMHLPPISLTGNLQHEPPSMHLPPISLTGNLQHEPPSMHLPPISLTGNLQHEPPSMHLPPISLTGNLQHEPPSMHLPPISLTGNLQHEVIEGRYDFENLLKIDNFDKLNKNMNIAVNNDYPLIFSFNVGKIGKINLLLVPMEKN